MSVPTTDLRILRHLDRGLLSAEAIDYFEQFEGGAEYVDADRTRDYVWTDEVVASTIGFAIADKSGEILRDGFGSVIEAETARSGAKVSFTLELAPEVVAPVAFRPARA